MEGLVLCGRVLLTCVGAHFALLRLGLCVCTFVCVVWYVGEQDTRVRPRLRKTRDEAPALPAEPRPLQAGRTHHTPAHTGQDPLELSTDVPQRCGTSLPLPLPHQHPSPPHPPVPLHTGRWLSVGQRLNALNVSVE